MPALVGRPAPPGSTIGVVTPGSPPETRAEVERGIGWWESQGYRVKLMPGALERDDWHGGSPEVRAADLQAAFADPEVDVVQTMRGGYGSAQTIPLLDFEAIKETPKAFFGLSDITALHAALLARAGLATFYGPSLSMLGQPSPASFTTERFLQVLRGETTGPVPEDSERLTVVSIAGGKASGRLVGGCLLDFIFTIGTPWEPDLDDAIFFFEDAGSAPIQIDRPLLYPRPAGEVRQGARNRRRRARRLRVGQLHDRAALEDPGGGPHGAAGRPRRARALQPAARPRCITGDAAARSASDSRRGFEDVDDRRARARRLSNRLLVGIEVAQVFGRKVTLSYRRGISGLVSLNPLEGPGRSSILRIAPMVRRFLLVAAVAALAAAAATVLRRMRGRGGPETNGGYARTEELRREIEAARARLRESIRSQEG